MAQQNAWDLLGLGNNGLTMIPGTGSSGGTVTGTKKAWELLPGFNINYGTGGTTGNGTVLTGTGLDGTGSTGGETDPNAAIKSLIDAAIATLTSKIGALQTALGAYKTGSGSGSGSGS